MKKIILVIILVSFVKGYDRCFAQIKPMGFTQKVVTYYKDKGHHTYYPKLKIIEDTLYVCSNTGIYKKDLSKDSDWGLYAFKESPVIEFVKNGDDLLAISMGTWDEKDSLILLSHDNGKSYREYQESYFWEEERNHIFRLVQNPDNKNSLLMKSRSGLSKSVNFGKEWIIMSPYDRGIDIAYAAYHPLDTMTIFYAGEKMTQQGEIFKSSDNGESWTSYIIPGSDNCVHEIDFHPTDPDILVFGGEAVIGKSTDKGETWKLIELWESGMYFYNILFDKVNPSILYASGFHGDREKNDILRVYRSLDMGDSWHLAFEEVLDMNCGEVIDMVKYKNKLIFYTRECGLFELEVEDAPPVSKQEITHIPEVTISINSTENLLYVDCDTVIDRWEIIDITGHPIRQIAGNVKEVDISLLNRGVYLARFYLNKKEKITKKVYI